LLKNVNWISQKPKKYPIKFYAKVRYRDEDKECSVFYLEGNSYLVKFKSNQKAITPGQSIVFYDKNGICYGGGIISKRDIPFLGEKLDE
jgi:Predicted tRNA(5-methylaminomethyl-2-thiouridylate) methyltransferase, contains the PP-loop ATPase domain